MSDGYELHERVVFLLFHVAGVEESICRPSGRTQEALRRHLLFYNTEAAIGGTLIAGIVTSMEEQKAQGGDVPEEAIINVKNSLMGPFAGIGDTIILTNLRPLIFSLFISFGLQGYWWAAVVPVVILVAITQLEGYNLIRIGYRLGTRAASNLLQSGSIQKIIQFFGVLGPVCDGFHVRVERQSYAWHYDSHGRNAAQFANGFAGSNPSGVAGAGDRLAAVSLFE